MYKEIGDPCPKSHMKGHFKGGVLGERASKGLLDHIRPAGHLLGTPNFEFNIVSLKNKKPIVCSATYAGLPACGIKLKLQVPLPFHLPVSQPCLKKTTLFSHLQKKSKQIHSTPIYKGYVYAFMQRLARKGETIITSFPCS